MLRLTKLNWELSPFVIFSEQILNRILEYIQTFLHHTNFMIECKVFVIVIVKFVQVAHAILPKTKQDFSVFRKLVVW